MSRRAALQRQLLPVLLGWLADGVDPDAGLLAFRRVSEALASFDAATIAAMRPRAPQAEQTIASAIPTSASRSVCRNRHHSNGSEIPITAIPMIRATSSTA